MTAQSERPKLIDFTHRTYPSRGPAPRWHGPGHDFGAVDEVARIVDALLCDYCSGSIPENHCTCWSSS
jgi:hypothetical protein